VNTSSAGLNDVEIIQKNGKIVRKHRTMTTRCTKDRPSRSRCLRPNPLVSVTISAIVDTPLDVLELQPGQDHGRDEDDDGNGTRGPDLEEFESLFIEVIDDIRS